MPALTIKIAGRSFEVACQNGEESYLETAAKMLDDEASVLGEQAGRLPESRMLLMAGLMLADKTAGFEERLKAAEAALAEKEAELETLRNAPAPEPEKVQVPVVPEAVTETLAELAARAESLAAELEEQGAS